MHWAPTVHLMSLTLVRLKSRPAPVVPENAPFHCMSRSLPLAVMTAVAFQVEMVARLISKFVAEKFSVRLSAPVDDPVTATVPLIFEKPHGPEQFVNTYVFVLLARCWVSVAQPAG